MEEVYSPALGDLLTVLFHFLMVHLRDSWRRLSSPGVWLSPVSNDEKLFKGCGALGSCVPTHPANTAESGPGRLALKHGEQRIHGHCASCDGVNGPCFMTYSRMCILGRYTFFWHFSRTPSSFASQIINSPLKALAKTLDACKGDDFMVRLLSFSFLTT